MQSPQLLAHHLQLIREVQNRLITGARLRLDRVFELREAPGDLVIAAVQAIDALLLFRNAFARDIVAAEQRCSPGA